MEVAIIGASGFLGTALQRKLRGTDVSVYTRAVPFLDTDGRAAEGLASARTAYWLATQINPQIAEQQPERVVADREAFERFLDALDPSSTVVMVSSGGTLYDTGSTPPYVEASPTLPLSAYGRAKLDLEALLASRRPAGTHVTLRVSNAYGPGQRAANGQGVIAYWLQAARNGEDLTVFGDPATSRDYVFVDDVARALALVHAADGPLPAVVNVGSGRATSLADLAETVLDVVGHPDLRVLVTERRSFDVPHTWLGIGLAAEVLGWHPTTELRTGIAAAWAALR